MARGYRPPCTEETRLSPNIRNQPGACEESMKTDAITGIYCGVRHTGSVQGESQTGLRERTLAQALLRVSVCDGFPGQSSADQFLNRT